jgi:hypothetical protein
LGRISPNPTAEFDEAFRFEVPLAGYLAKVRDKRERLLRKKAASPPAPVPEVADSPAKLDVDLRCFPGLAKAKSRPPARDSLDGLLLPEFTDWHAQVGNPSQTLVCCQPPRPIAEPLARRPSAAARQTEPVFSLEIPARASRPAGPYRSSPKQRCMALEASSPPHAAEPCYKKSLLQLHMNKSGVTNKSQGLTASTAQSAAQEQPTHDSCPLTRKDYRRASHEEFSYFKLQQSHYRKKQQGLLRKSSPRAVPREAPQPREFFGLHAVCGSCSPASRRTRLGKSLARRVAEKLSIPSIWHQA